MAYDFVFFWFMNDWGKYGRAYEMVIRHLAKMPEVNRILCIFPPGMIWNGYYLFPLKISKISDKIYLLNPNLRIIPQSLVPFSWRENINDSITDLSFNILFKYFRIRRDNTILWVFPPNNYINKLINLVPHRFLVAQIVDNNVFNESCSLKESNHIKEQYEDISKKSDIVITSSKKNYEIFSHLNSNCYIFENAVDEIFISNPSALPYKRSNSRPRLGYVGWITPRTDLDLIHYIAKKRPNYDLIIAGPIEYGFNIDKLSYLPNVVFTGTIPYERVPEFIRTIDVCIIPHIDSLYSKSMSPLKIFQYIGSGRPIVSTMIAGVERFKEIIRIADDYDDFIKYIDEALIQDNEDISMKRIEVAKKETWDIRINEMYNIVASHFHG